MEGSSQHQGWGRGQGSHVRFELSTGAKAFLSVCTGVGQKGKREARLRKLRAVRHPATELALLHKDRLLAGGSGTVQFSVEERL